MAERMQKFVSVGQIMPAKRLAEQRSGDFHEIYAEFIADKAAQQASRCAQCGVPFCQTHCPLQNNIPDWLRLTAEGRLREAYELSAATNSMPEVCGRICPQDRLCEGACVIEQSAHGAVTIGAVEKYLTATAWREGWVAPLKAHVERSESVGIVGAGPAGLAAAERMRQRGYQVTVYDRHDRIGGLLVYGIPNFKLEKDVVERRAQRLIDGGVKFELNCNVGETISFADLRAKHDAVLIATGVYKPKPLNAPNDRAVVKALDFLITANRVGLGDDVSAFTSGALNAKDRRVVVIGGGDTAMDCVTPPDVDWLAAPKSVRAGKSPAVNAVRMQLGQPDESGRQSSQEVPGSTYEVAGDLIIAALGFDAEDMSDWNVPVTRWGTVEANPITFEVSDGVYAAATSCAVHHWSCGRSVKGATLRMQCTPDSRSSKVAAQ